MSSQGGTRWAPELAGLAIGALETFAMGTAKRPLGVTSAFETAASALARRLAPQASRVNEFVARRETTPKIDWEVLLAPGIVLGAFLASRASGTRGTTLPDAWRARFGESRGKRYAAAFCGGALMMFGARLGKGCTSGHGISGTMQLAAASLAFDVAISVSSVLTAKLLFRGGAR
ncbi:YeeE/YedE thiosulfate transporter family protein [Sorangium sp. So ce448]|uniref:YeeE/YedE thiosulfate transporter family protein n=1 Tax=Sorangium sp. So ce448 TaxID=3133314 RepID=UPI003F5E6FCB